MIYVKLLVSQKSALPFFQSFHVKFQSGSLGSASHVPNTDSQSNSSRIQKSRNTEEEDEEDFINLKADVETGTDMSCFNFVVK